jgi:CheY-like chemotaxis protein
MPRILVIDDEPLIRSAVVTILTRAGFSVEEASDGRAGLAKFHKTPPDVVITDIFMPHRDGIEIVMELKRLYPHTTIIAMTGGGQMRMMEIGSAAKILGADHILHKPFEQESLLATVNDALGTSPPPISQHGA